MIGKLHWVLQDGFSRDPAWQQFEHLLTRLDCSWSKHKVIPFSGELDTIPEVENNLAVCWGSYSMRHTAKKYGWRPGVFDLDHVTHDMQLAAWGNRLLNHDAVIQPVNEAELSDLSFVRPAKDNKSFTGRLFTPEEFQEWKDKIVALGDNAQGTLSMNTEILITTPKRIFQEVRVWVVDNRPVTMSTYKIGDRVVYDSKVDERFRVFASALVSPISTLCWNPARAFVVDICETAEGMRVVEINNINSSGFYSADIAKIISSIESMRH